MALIEALVALAIAAMTLLLLTSATWGLRHAEDRRVAAQATDATDWLAARRIVQRWGQGLTSARSERANLRLIGSATTVRLVLSAHTAEARSEAVGELRIVQDSGRYDLLAARHLSDRDARTATGETPLTPLLSSDAVLRFSYLYARNGRAGPQTWRYETDPEDLPLAIAVEEDGTRRIIAPVLSERSAACVAAVGAAGLEEPRCVLR